jgi:PAS domain S-box-containing protein
MQQERYRYTVVHDITKRKQAEQKLKESEERYRVLTQSANDAIITINSQGKIVDWNRGAEKIFGYAESEIIGQNLSAIVPKQFSATHQENINRVLNGGPAHVLGKTLELTGLHRNGHEFPVEISLASWENASGTFFTGIIRDITRRREIEKSLIDSEANLALAQQIAHIGSWDWNMTTNKVQWSKEMFHVFDMDPEANYGAPESIIRLLHPDDVESFRESLRENIATGGSPALEYRVIHKDGSVHTIFAEGRIEFDATGKPLRNVGTVQDITERKRAEEEMRRAYSFLDSIIENIPDMIVIKDAKTLQFISFNRAGEHLLGISKEELAGKYDHDIFPAEYADIYNETDREVIQSRKMMDIPEEQIETRTNGLRILHTYKVPILDAQGEPEYLLCISEDITELKLAEQARKISEEKYKTMLDASPDGILLTDLKGIITEASEIGLELFGADKREDLVGKNFFRFIPSAEKKNIREIIEKTMNEGLAQNTELTIKKKNQAVFVSETSTTLLQDANGEPLSFMIIVRDISQRKKTETKQMHADRMANLGEMASGIAHEINQPLNIISMVMDKILIETTRTANVDKGFLAVKSEKIFENITRIRNIIDHVRAFSRTNDDYVLTAFDLNLSIRNAVSMIAEQFKHLGITLNLMLDNEIPPITGNTYKFEQVIINLLVNAKDAVIDRRTQQQDSSELIIGIRSFQDNQLLIVEITDNGIGIGKDDINNIWLPFYTTKDEGKGTGLGLSICYQIIKSMGGTIDIASTKLKGTTIKIALNRQK